LNALLVLDTGVVGLLSHPAASEQRDDCRAWLLRRVGDGARVVVPEIADYEVRRELIRAGKVRGLRRLDDLQRQLPYLSISTKAMRLAAQLWADARRMGRPTSGDAALDGDAILAAQARTLADELKLPVSVVTTNVAHLSLFVNASVWRDA